MIKGFATASLLLLFATTAALAQQSAGEKALLDTLDKIDANITPAPGATPSAGAFSSSGTSAPGAVKAPKTKTSGTNGPTEITCTQEATFDEKTHIAVFYENVKVKDPQFTLFCDKLTAYLKKEEPKGAANGGPGGSPTPKKAAPASSPGGADAKKGGGGLDKADAEGHVIIIQDKPDPKGGKPTRYTGKAEKAHYNGLTGDVTLTGWPQVEEGINTHISTDRSTTMIMNQSGQLHTTGPSKTVIADKSELEGSPSPSPDANASPSPSSTSRTSPTLNPNPTPSPTSTL